MDKVDAQTAAENKKLIAKYPFLLPRNVWTDELSESYDYSYTKLDDMEPGWRAAFGMQMVDDIEKILEKANYQDKYRVLQIKEKFGGLRWYDNGAPNEIFEELFQLVSMYEHISRYTCVKCGKFPVKMRNVCGWISPYCDDCLKDLPDSVVETENEEPFNPVIHMRRWAPGVSENYIEYDLDCSDIVSRMQCN